MLPRTHQPQESVPKARHQTGRTEWRGCPLLIPRAGPEPTRPCLPQRLAYAIWPAQERPDRAVCVLELHVDKCARKNSRGPGQSGTPTLASLTVSSTMTLTGKIEDKPLNTSRRKRMVTSVERAPTSWVLFCCFSPTGSPSTAEAPQP